MDRRCFLVFAAGASGLAILPGRGLRATPAAVAAAIKEVAGEAELQRGKVKLDLPLMVENGNVVPLTVSVDAPLSGPDRVLSVHLFAEGNPLPNVAHFHFGPRAGKPQVQTRIRLATSQAVIAVARLADGSCWTDSVDLMVTLAACLD
jgi:sulfur-oxidizing protein SoxY